MPKQVVDFPEKTSVTLDEDVRKYVLQCKQEGRTFKWVVNNALRKQMLAEQALAKQLPRARVKA